LVSPLKRAWRTAELAGFESTSEVDPDLVEWDYGAYDGLRTDEIRQRRPDWSLFRDGCPGGESLAEVTARADRLITRLRAIGHETLVFSSGHILRVLAARWLGIDGTVARYLLLDPAAISVLGYQRELAEPIIRLWNDRRHLHDVRGIE